MCANGNPCRYHRARDAAKGTRIFFGDGPKAALRRHKNRNREHIVRSKTRPCVDCNVQYNSWVMQFDHRDPSQKLFTMSEFRRGMSMKRLQAEIAKCDVVCANCHAERTHRQLLARMAIAA